MNTPLQKAAQALLTAATEEEWYEGYSGLRKALDAELAQSVEPVLYQSRMRPTWVVHGTGWFAWESCSKEAASDYVKTPLLHEWEYEVRTLYLHPPQPHAEPEQSGERAELANEIRSTANHLSRYDTPGFPMNPFAAVCHKAADMLEADAQQAKRVPMAGEEIEKIADGCRACAGSVWPHAFARAIEAHRDTPPAQKPTDWSAA